VSEFTFARENMSASLSLSAPTIATNVRAPTKHATAYQ
jgi:hypothetical protein